MKPNGCFEQRFKAEGACSGVGYLKDCHGLLVEDRGMWRSLKRSTPSKKNQKKLVQKKQKKLIFVEVETFSV